VDKQRKNKKKKLEGFYAIENEFNRYDSYLALHKNSFEKYVKMAYTSNPTPLKGTWTVARDPKNRLTKLAINFLGEESVYGDHFGSQWKFKADIVYDANDCFTSDVRVTQEEFKKMLKEPKRVIENFSRCGVGVAEVVGDACCHEAVSNIARELHARVPKSTTHFNRLTLELSKIVEKYANMCLLEAMTDAKIQKMIAQDFVQMIPELRDTFSNILTIDAMTQLI